MNRETKIGLLVGLAFIIVIGVLISDYIQSATQPQPANFVATTQTLRQGIEVPGAIAPRPGGVANPAQIDPGTVIATGDLLRATPPPEANIRIGPGQPAGVAPEPGGLVSIGPPAGAGTPPGVPGALPLIPLQAEAPSTQTAVVTPTDRTPEAELARLLVTPSVSSPAAGAGPRESAGGGPGVRTHVAVAGDTVYRLTQRYYGGYTPARAELIVRANPSMGGRADRIIVGQTYIIPPLPGEAASAAAAAENAPPPAARNTPAPGGASATAATGPAGTNRPAARPAATTYTVKAGDSLWRIADRAGVSVNELKQANRDVLRGSDVVRPGMVLRLPAPQSTAAAD